MSFALVNFTLIVATWEQNNFAKISEKIAIDIYGCKNNFVALSKSKNNYVRISMVSNVAKSVLPF